LVAWDITCFNLILTSTLAHSLWGYEIWNQLCLLLISWMQLGNLLEEKPWNKKKKKKERKNNIDHFEHFTE